MMKILNRSVFAGAVLLLALAGAPAHSAERDFETEEINRALVLDFYEMFFNRHQVDEAAKQVSEGYIQHNPTVPNGKEPFVSYYRDFFKSNPESRVRVTRSAVEGDIVWLHVHSVNDAEDRGEAVVDIFRVQDGLIVEHWDVIQPVPEKAENDNGMF